MAENDIMNKMPAIVVIIGAIIAIVAFFLAWLTNPDVTGLDFVTNKSITEYDMTYKVQDLLKCWQIWIPLISLILAIIVALGAIASFFVEIPKMYLNIGYIVLGLVILVLAIVFFTTQVDLPVLNGFTMKFSDAAGVGIWLSLAGGVIIALIGVLDIAGVFDKLTGGSAQ